MKEGNRKCPGRPALPEDKKRKRILVLLSPATVETLDRQSLSRGRLIDAAVMEKYGKGEMK